jgi:hypothetical protein
MFASSGSEARIDFHARSRPPQAGQAPAPGSPIRTPASVWTSSGHTARTLPPRGPYTDRAMANRSNPANQKTSRERRRGRVEAGIRVLAPFLDLLLLVGDRVSRLLERDDPDYVLARMPTEGGSAPRGLRDRPVTRG